MDVRTSIIEVATASSQLYQAVFSYIEQYMKKYDCSHDFSHIGRVLALAKHIYSAEALAEPSRVLDEESIVLAALLHDVADKKYVEPGDDGEDVVERLLLQFGSTKSLAEKVAIIVKNVSYSHEIKHPSEVKAVLAAHPELGIVQDADRLDAIGAVGIARCFAYGAVKQSDRGLAGSVEHFVEKLENLQDMMKTETGRKLAAERTRRLKEFRSWWEDENSFALQPQI